MGSLRSVEPALDPAEFNGRLGQVLARKLPELNMNTFPV